MYGDDVTPKIALVTMAAAEIFTKRIPPNLAALSRFEAEKEIAQAVDFAVAIVDRANKVLAPPDEGKAE